MVVPIWLMLLLYLAGFCLVFTAIRSRTRRRQ